VQIGLECARPCRRLALSVQVAENKGRLKGVLILRQRMSENVGCRARPSGLGVCLFLVFSVWWVNTYG
jgi:hypothetical protein